MQQAALHFKANTHSLGHQRFWSLLFAAIGPLCLVMHTRRLCRSGTASFFVVLGLLLPDLAYPSTNDHVVLITIDGLAAFYLADPQAPVPTLRKLAAEGASAEALRVSNPATTWPNHTTLVTGVHPEKHSVLFNGLLVRGGPGEPVRIEAERDERDLVAVATIYDQLHRAGYRTAAINWPGTRGATTLDDNFSDAPDRIARTTPRLRAELVRDGVLENGEDAGFLRKSAAAADQAWCAAALHLLRTRPPHFLLLHLLATDAIQHRYGPNSPAAYTALALADAQVALVLRALESAGIRERTTLFAVSDHGFARPSKLINPNVILRKAGLMRPGPRRRAQSVSEGGTAFVYLTEPASVNEDRAKVIALLRGVQGIQKIVEPLQYEALHLPAPDKNPQMGDLLLVAKEGYAFSDEFFEDEVITPLPASLGSHGYLSSDPQMNGIFVAWGRGIKPGTKMGVVDNIDVAPTMAAMLGENLSGADGRVLREIFDSKQQ
jgi:predicted AlkP superfamily pyrophosphatase or phosphodiesterase